MCDSLCPIYLFLVDLTTKDSKIIYDQMINELEKLWREVVVG
jgi:hypothetical protein